MYGETKLNPKPLFKINSKNTFKCTCTLTVDFVLQQQKRAFRTMSNIYDEAFLRKYVLFKNLVKVSNYPQILISMVT